MTDLSFLGLNENESNIYRILSVSGQLTSGEIRNITKLNIEQSTSAIKTLLDKKLIREVPGIQGRYASILPTGNLKTEIETSILNIEALSRELSTTSETVVSNLKEQMDTGMNEFNQSMEAKKAEINDVLNQLNVELKETSDEIQNNLTAKVDSFKASSVSKTRELGNKINQSIDEQKVNAGLMIDSISSSNVENTNSAKSDVEEKKIEGKAPIEKADISSLNDTVIDLIADINNFQTESKVTIDESKSTMLSSVDKIDTNSNQEMVKLTAIGNTYVSDAKQLGESIKGSMHNLISENKQLIEKANTDFVSKQTESISSIKLLKEENDNISAEISTSINELENASQTHRTKTLESMSSNLQKIEGDVNTLVDNTDAEFSGHLVDVKSQLDETISEELSKLTNILEQQFNTALEQAKQRLTEFNQSFIGRIDGMNTKLNEERLAKVNELKSTVGGSVSGLKDTLNSDTNSLAEAERAVFQNTRTQLSSFKSNFDTKLGDTITTLEGLTNSLNDISTQMSSNLAAFQENRVAEVDATVSKHEVAFGSNFTEAISAISNVLNEEVNTLKSQIGDSTDVLNTKLLDKVEGLKSKIDTQIASIRNSIDVIQQKSTAQFHNLVDKTMNVVIGLIDSNHDNVNEQVGKLREAINNLEQSMKSSVSGSISELETELVGTLDAIKNDLGSFLSTSINSIDNKKSRLNEIGNDAINKSSDLVRSGTDNQISAVEISLNQYNKKYTEVTNKVSEPTSALAKILASLEGAIESTETPKINTTHIVGKDAILEYITDFIGRIKSKATLLVPSITFLNDEAIMALPRTRQLTIISYIDEIANKDWIEKMHSATPNITLRTIQTRAAGGGLPDFIGIEREQEEILLSTIDDASGEYVGIVSSSEYFVKILGNIVIADYARGKSRQLQK